MQRLKFLRMTLIGIALATVALLASPLSAQQWRPSPPTNLKVLPVGSDVRVVIEAMKGFTRALGVRCEHCHVHKGANPGDLSTFDFASDDKRTKQTARVMLRMVQTLNNDILKDVGEPRAAGEAKVTCLTCHRGETLPATRRPDVPAPAAKPIS